MENLAPKVVKEKLESEKNKICFIDVRSEDEFLSGHVPGAVCMPLDRIQSGEVELPRDRLVVLSCQAGLRSAKARELLQIRGFTNLVEMEGGFSAWKNSGLPINRIRKTIPLIRQVMLTAGSFIFFGTLLGILVNPAFFAIPVFFGAGLTVSGATGWCGMAFLLERMPWNQVASNHFGKVS